MFAKAALISFGTNSIFGLPTIVVFQYNPVELARNLQQKRSQGCGSGEPSQAEAFRVDGPPNEPITLKAEFDSDDSVMDGNPIGLTVGVRPALASLEMLLYPTDRQDGLGAALGAISTRPWRLAPGRRIVLHPSGTVAHRVVCVGSWPRAPCAD